MEGCSNNNTENCPNLLDLISKERRWLVNVEPEQIKSHGYSSAVKNKLELKLGPPGDDEDWSPPQNKNHPWMSSSSSSQINYNNQQQTNFSAFLQKFSPSQSSTAMGNESAQLCCNEILDLQQSAENKPFSPAHPSNLPLPNSSQKRTAPAPVVGWPPIRSFRKNLASTSASKPPHTDSQNENKIPIEKPGETITKKSTFVKINMDGVPIGRKVDLNSHGSYKKLSTAVDELFRGLLAAQRDSSAGGIMNTLEEEKPITGVLGGSGEYTLVYEDNEGDRMLVGDVPWHMFVSTVKRLRVLKSSEVSALNLGNGKREKITNV